MIVRAYYGVIAEIAKNFVLGNEVPFQNWYYCQYAQFSYIEGRNDLTEGALRVLKPNAVLR